MPRSTELTNRLPDILKDAQERIMNGDTLDQIADANNIPKRTLIRHLSSLGPEYQEAQQAWIDSMLADAAEEIEQVVQPLVKDDVPVSNWHLTRAKHSWERATFYAERRDKRYQVKQEQTVTVLPVFTMILDQGGVNVQGQGQGGDCVDISPPAQSQILQDKLKDETEKD